MTEPLIHVVDDDEAVRDSLAAMLGAAGYRVAVHADAASLLGAGPEPESACILLDVRLPDIDGLAVQAELARRGVRVPVILVTGHGDVPMAVAAMKAGAVDFIEKPARGEVLLASLARALEHLPQVPEDASGDDVAERLGELTARERDVFEQLALGRSNKAIANALGISPRTVEVHRARVMAKLGARSLADIVRLALRSGGA